MSYVSDVDAKGVTVTLHRVGMRAFLTGLAVAALVVVALTLRGVGAA